MTERRRMLEKIEPAAEFEIIDAPSKQPDNIDLQLQRQHEIKMKSLESLPDVIGIAQDLIGIWRIREETNRDIKLIEKDIEKLKAQTEDFVKREIAKRDTTVTRAQQVQIMLRDLYSGIGDIQGSDELKKKLIEAFESSVKVVLEEK